MVRRGKRSFNSNYKKYVRGTRRWVIKMYKAQERAVVPRRQTSDNGKYHSRAAVFLQAEKRSYDFSFLR